MTNKYHRQNFRFGGKSSLQKIAEAFGPKKKNKKPKKRIMANSGMSVKGDDKRDIRKVEQMIGASESSKREKGIANGKPISRSKNPGLLAMSKTEKGKEAVKKMKFNPNRIVAKKGGRS
jgi:hypothetical protein